MGASISALIPELQPYCRALLNIAAQAGIQPRITSTRRTFQEQTMLYRKFQSGASAYPVAPPGTSAHEFGYAFDMVTLGMNLSDLTDLGQVWEGWGGVWGGHFKDPIHFEYPGFNNVPVVPGLDPVAQKSSSPIFHTIAQAADLIVGFAPGVGEVELGAELLKLGFPESQVLDFLSGPFSYLSNP